MTLGNIATTGTLSASTGNNGNITVTDNIGGTGAAALSPPTVQVLFKMLVRVVTRLLEILLVSPPLPGRLARLVCVLIALP